MIKIDFAMIVHNGMPFVELNLKNIYPYANRIIIIEGPVSFYQKMGFGPSNDGTIDIIKNFPDPDKKIFLESGLWKEKDDMVRAQEKYFNGDYVWCPDADEFWKPEDIERIISYLETHPNVHSMSFRLYSFFAGFERYIGGFEASFETHRIQKLSANAKWKTHRPPTLIWTPTGKTCREMGHIDGTKELGVRIFHYSHLPISRMAHKSKYYNQLSTSILPNYFEQVYIPWLKAKNDQERLAIEKKFNGVQEFKASCRTEAFTVKFEGKHPKVIEEVRKQIETQIEKEKKVYF